MARKKLSEMSKEELVELLKWYQERCDYVGYLISKLGG